MGFVVGLCDVVSLSALHGAFFMEKIMSKPEIFENSYLKSEFINPNYRGLVGWPCKEGEKLLVVHNGHHVAYEWNDMMSNGMTSGVEIKEFKYDIPVGELCWLKVNNNWALLQYGNSVITMASHYVPYLIAETSSIAEDLKDWNK